MKNREYILKDSPEYEDYSENEAHLTVAEMKEYGLLKCGGCCSTNGGCKNKKGCCKQK